MEVSPYERSITSGVYNFIRWIGAAIAPVMSGLLKHLLSNGAPYALTAVIVLQGIMIIKLGSSHVGDGIVKGNM